MINLCEYAKSIVDESLLDDIDDQLDAGDKFVDNERVNNWAKNSRRKTYITRQKKGYVLFGDFVIDDIDEKKYTGTPIKRATGSISISGCDIESLEGIFLPDCEIDGSLTIEDCPNLVSLEGGPLSCKQLTISGCKKLKDLRGRTVVSGNLFLSNNGKKFKEEQLRKDDKNIAVIKKIFCSGEYEEANLNEAEFVNEAFAAPQLKILADAIKNGSNAAKLNMTKFMARVQLDKIKSSQVHVYNTYDDWAIKDAKAFIQGKRPGFMFTLNAAGEATYIIRQHAVLAIPSKDSYWKMSGDYSEFYDRRPKDIEQLIAGEDTIIMVDVEGMEGIYNMQKDREKSREGAIALQRGKERSGKVTGRNYWDDKANEITATNIRYYQSIAQQNRKRYAEMLVKIRAERAVNSGTFEKLKRQIDNLFSRYTALLSKILKDPAKYNYYDVEWLHDEFNQVSTHGTGKHKYYTQYGLFMSIQKYFTLLIQSSKGNVTASSTISDELKKLEDQIQRHINNVDNELRKLESK